MNHISKQFTRSQRSALSFFVMTAIAGYITLFLLDRADETIDELHMITETYYDSPIATSN